MNKDKIINRMVLIANHMAEDAQQFDGKPFNGKTVAEYFGNHGAAIAALAKTIKEMVEKDG